MSQNQKILLSGIKSTGRPHIGNYFGAMKQFVDMQGEYDSRVFIPDLHSMTSIQDGRILSENTLDVAIDYLAIGLDPKKVIIFKQSDLPEVTELTWIFNCLTTMPYLMRAHAFKDAEAKNKDINVGTFTYPLLMAADILIHNADVVPVGQDQKQHVEMARDIAEKFNRTFGAEIFKQPTAVIKEDVAVVPGIDGQKMSKSYNNHIPLFSTDEEIRKLVMSIVTDSSGGIPQNVFNIHKLLIGEGNVGAKSANGEVKSHLQDEDSLKKFYEENAGQYKVLKEKLVEDLSDFIRPLRERREKIAKDADAVRTMLAKNAEQIRESVHPLMYEVRKAVGFVV